MRAEREFAAMGTTAHVVVVGGGEAHLDLAEARVEQLEARWSRFRESSEVNAMNRADGAPTIVSHDTALLVERCLRAWRRTHGAFDPTVHDAVVANGYDRDFAAIEDHRREAPDTTAPAPGLAGTVVDVERGLVWLRAGVRIDPGGIGKGLAADLVSCEVRAAGAEGVCVNLGGDLRVEGRPPNGDRWSVTIEDPFDASRELARIGIAAGAVATSSRLRRAWTRRGARLHHVIDPRTGRPADVRTVATTAVARSGWWAEASATSALLAGDAADLRGRAGLVAIDEDGGVHATPDLEGALTCSAR